MPEFACSREFQTSLITRSELFSLLFFIFVGIYRTDCMDYMATKRRIVHLQISVDIRVMTHAGKL